MANLPRNLAVLDPKPKGISVLDTKPRNTSVIDSKPRDISVFGETVIYTDSRTLGAGMPMGLLLALTYPVSTTIQINRP